MIDLVVNNVSIKNEVLSYSRDMNICTGIATLVFETLHSGIKPWDKVVLYEDGVKKGTFNVISVKQSSTKGTFTVECQDNSLKLINYFIAESYFIDYPTYTRYWIEKFLTEATINYNFNTASQGSLVSNNTTLGMGMAYDIITTLLQQSGWYLKFNANGVAVIGSLTKSSSSADVTIDDSSIIEIVHHKDDSTLRNRAVVWGTASLEEAGWVWADKSRKTPWDVSNKDKRTILMANSNIKSSADAEALAYKILDTFAELKNIVTITVAGFIDAEVGDFVKSKSEYWSGMNMITSLSVNMTENGATTTITLNEKCPRLFGYFGWGGGFVYAGTDAGVWRKEIGTSSWSAFSSGISSDYYEIVDLIVKDDIFACVGRGDLGAKVYYRTSSDPADNWIQAPMSGNYKDFDGRVWFPFQMNAVAVDIDTYTHNIIATYTTKDEYSSIGHRTWVEEFTPAGKIIEYRQVFVSENSGRVLQKFKGIDIAKMDSGETMPTARAPIEYALSTNREAIFGRRNVCPVCYPDSKAFTFGPISSEDFQIYNISPVYGFGPTPVIEDNVILSVRNDNCFAFFNFEDNPDNLLASGISKAWSTAPLKGLPTYWPENETRLWHRYTYHNANYDSSDTSNDYVVVDTTYYGGSGDYYSFDVYSISQLKNYHAEYHQVLLISDSNVIPSGIYSIDGVVPLEDTGVFLVGQTDKTENGYWLIKNGAWVRVEPYHHLYFDMNVGMVIQAVGGVNNRGRCFQIVNMEYVPNKDSYALYFEEVLKVSHIGTYKFFDRSESHGYSPAIHYNTRVENPIGTNGCVYVVFRYIVGFDDGIMGNSNSGILHWYYAYYDAESRSYDRVNIESSQFSTLQPNINRIGNSNWSILRPVPSGRGIAFAYLGYWKEEGEETHFNMIKHEIEKGNVSSDTLVKFYTFCSGCVEGGSINTCGGCNPEDKIHEGVFQMSDAAWVGFTIKGNLIVPRIRISMYGISYCNSCGGCMGVCGGCGYNSLSAYMVLTMDIDGGNPYYKIVGGTSSQRKPRECTACIDVSGNRYQGVCCCGDSDPLPIYSIDDFDYTYMNLFYDIKQLTSRSSPYYIYKDGIRSGIDDSVIVPAAAYNYLDNIYIYRQQDDFDGGWYYFDPLTRQNVKIVGGGELARGIVPGGPLSFPAVFSNGVFIHSSQQPGYLNTTIYKLSDNYILQNAEVCYLLKDRTDEEREDFKIIDMDFFDFKTESDKPLPLSAVTLSGTASISGIWTENAKVYFDLNTKGTIIPGEYNDVRSFYYSGEVDDNSLPYDIYTGVVDRTNKLLIFDGKSPWKLYNFYTASGGEPLAFETSNYGSNPYIWITTWSGGTSFFEKLAGGSTFSDHSSGAPPVKINVIRVDDNL